MTAAHPDLFGLAEQRLAWADRRQALLAQNIANTDTPGYAPKDVAPFAQMLARAGNVPLARTAPTHLAGATPLLDEARAAPRARAPNGNAVALDEQLTKVADTETTQSLVTSIYRKYLSLFGLALGRTS